MTIMDENLNNGMPEATDSTGYTDTTAYSSDTTTSYSSYSSEPEQKATLSIVSLVLGIVGLVFSCCCCLGVPFDIAAIVVGVIAKKKNVPSQGMALAGIILGAVALVIYLITVIINKATGAGEAFSNSFMEHFKEGLNSGAVMFF